MKKVCERDGVREGTRRGEVSEEGRGGEVRSEVSQGKRRGEGKWEGK